MGFNAAAGLLFLGPWVEVIEEQDLIWLDRTAARIDAQYGIYLGDNFNVRQLMLRAVHPQVLELPYNSREEDLRGLPEQPLSRSAKKLRLRKKQGQKRKFSAS